MSFHKPLVLCILDGWGIAPPGPANAISRANCMNFNNFWLNFPHTELIASGTEVGLPAGYVGNSEVGHLNLGAGRIVFQDLLRIDSSISDDSFFKNEAFLKAVDHIKTNGSNIHLLGLVGEGFVHSSINHLFALLELLKKKSVPPESIKLHLFTDGRDSPPSSAKLVVSQIWQKIESENLGQIASLSGRYYAMDRDNRWDRTAKAYFALLGNTAGRQPDPETAIRNSYLDGKTDEFIEPLIICNNQGNPLGPVSDNDAVVFFNFRPDRTRQLARAFIADSLDKIRATSGDKITTFNRGEKIKNLFFVTMTEYAKNLPVSAVAFPPQEVAIPLARVFAERGAKQLHLAETEKYAHVTYFFNGGREEPFPLEDRILVNSPKVASYDLDPIMAAPEITRRLVSKIATGVYDFIVVNFANADMVGHTGNLQAAIKAVQAVDVSLGQIKESVLEAGGVLVVTADHGNAEKMMDKLGNIDTEHNASPVPIIFAARQLEGQNRKLAGGILADVAPTILSMLNIPKPSVMTGNNLLA
ncbi:2,3-bisphosphoglycerate-independent phosphoglycerate mutase [Candidatus Curtissbacteria bacterium]|nr:2,3-bisphosphoglycerate-independent phosphoglycerate mutase [Candidatus Curtissbacteria bacterium]